MSEAISNTSPLLYLFRIGVLHWLPSLFDEVWAPKAVVTELEDGRRAGYHVPGVSDYDWLKVDDLQRAGIWISDDVKHRVLALAGEEMTDPGSDSP